MRLALYAMLLSVGFSLLCVRPARSGWEVPQAAEPVNGSHSSSEHLAALDPTSTPVALPEQARVPILMYHYVSELPPNPDRYRRDLTVSPEDFAAQLQYLDDAGYHAITLDDLYLYWTQGYPLPEKPIVLTFDDGYRDAYEIVFPMLLDHGFSGTFFVLATPAHFEQPEYLTWTQMQEMSDAGMDIQAHGRDHVDLRNRDDDYLIYQIVGIQEAIQYHTGRLPRFFCYPSGQYDANVIAVLEATGYWGAVTTQWGNTETFAGRYEMPRVRMRGSDTLQSFIGKLEG
jgi:peptidoglycan/xylan/chitin deacetylase (PgdA/CDA1 family)